MGVSEAAELQLEGARYLAGPWSSASMSNETVIMSCTSQCTLRQRYLEPSSASWRSSDVIQPQTSRIHRAAASSSSGFAML